jgi:ABC-type oligopeptide transport system substrate-binding subunit
MKKIALIIGFAAALVLGFSSCLSSSFASSGSSSSSSSSSRVTVRMYVNAPEDDLYASAAVLGFKALDSNYNGVVTLTYTGNPSIGSVAPVATYTGYCNGVKSAIETGYGKKCTLSFNTKADGSGYTLDFSSNSAIIRSLLSMAVYNYTTIYAIYK